MESGMVKTELELTELRSKNIQRPPLLFKS